MPSRRTKANRGRRTNGFDRAVPGGERSGLLRATVDAPSESPLTVAALFAGIGGIEVGLERSGHRTAMLCEIDEGARVVLEKHFHGLPIEPDVREVRSLDPGTELLTAGFPCQDLSQAGSTKGITGARSGLVGNVFRLLERKRVPWVLVENVPFMLQLGRGRALDVIVTEFERLGYRWAYRVVDTMAFGIPQRRRRVYFLASKGGDPREVLFADDAGEPRPSPYDRKSSFGFYWTEGVRGLGGAVDAIPTLKGGSTVGIPSPPAIRLPGGRVVTPDIADAERLQGFEPDWTLPAEARKRRGYRWSLVGNAVTVDVAEWIGLRLRAPRDYDGSADPRLPKGSRWPTAAWGDRTGRFRAVLSEWPVRLQGEALHDFLDRSPRDLSARATAGFLKRLRSSSLRCYPDWFIDDLEAHRSRLDRQLSLTGAKAR